MEIFLVCFNAVFPIFAIMAAGYAARCFGLLGPEDVGKMNKVAFAAFLPVTLFNDICTAELSSAVRPKLIVYAVAALLLMLALSIAVTLLLVKDKSKQGVVIQGLFRSNFAIIGVPLAASLAEGGDVSAVAVLLAVIVPINNVAAVVVLSVFNGKKPQWGKILRDIGKNPLIIGCALGLLFSGLHLTLPKAAASAVSTMSRVASPLMMFLLGAFFSFGSLGRQRRELALICLGRLLMFPGIFLAGAFALGFQGVETAGLISMLASPSAVSSFTMAQQMGGDAELAGDAVVVSSALCPFTIFAWCFLLKTLGAL